MFRFLRMQSTRKTNLFVVGAMKAGTTSFCETIGDHPEIFFAPIKEPNYFVKDLPPHIFKETPFFSIDNYFQKDFPNPLHIAHLKTLAHYSRIFEFAKEEKYLGEGSTAYLHAPESAALIHEYNPDAKIIILIRNGLKRSFSHYKMDVGLGKTVGSFEELMTKDLADMQSGIQTNWSYLGMSLYYENIKRFKVFFGKNVFVLNFDVLVKNQEEEFEKLFSFLEIKNIPLSLKKSNESKGIRFKRSLYFLKQSGLKDLLSKLLPLEMRHKIFKKIQKKEPLKMELSDSLKNEIEIIFDEDDLKLKSKC